MMPALKRGMTVRLTDRTAIDEVGTRMGYWPNLEVGERGVITKSEDENGLAECRFADCAIIVDRSMVELG